MSASLVSLLQKMMGFAILERNMFWSLKKEFAKRQICIDIISSQQSFRVAKKHLVHILNPGLHRNLIAHGNAAKALEIIKDKVDNELNIPVRNDDDSISNAPGNALLITGNIEPELKLLRTDTFAARLEETMFDFENTLCEGSTF